MASRTSGWTPALLSLAKLRVVLVRACSISEQCTRVDQRLVLIIGARLAVCAGPAGNLQWSPAFFMANTLQGHFARTKSLLVAALVVTGVMLGCSSNASQKAQANGPSAMPVKVLEARAIPINDATEYVATLKSRDSAVIMPQVDGQVTKIYVHSGDRVGAGTPLMEIDPLKQQATVKSQQSSRAAQEANLSWAKQQYERARGLYSAGVISKQELDQAKTALDTTQSQVEALDAQVREQEVQLHYYKVAAPWNGVVGEVEAHAADRVPTSAVRITVHKPGSLEVSVYVPIEPPPPFKMNLPVQVLDSEGKVLANTK